MKLLGELDEGKLHVQFDVGGENLSLTLPRILAALLEGNLVFESYVPPKPQREHRILVRHRAGLVKTRTETRKRIHALLAKHELPYTFTDLFGKQGHQWLESLQLQRVDQTVLNSNLALLKRLDEQIKTVTVEVAKTACNQEDIQILMTMPGIDFYCDNCV